MTGYLVISESSAERARKADEEAQKEFWELVVGYSDRFTLLETAKLVHFSAGSLRTRAAARQITFPDKKDRTKAEELRLGNEFRRLRALHTTREVNGKRPAALAGSLKITPQLQLEGKKADWARQRVFNEKMTRLAENMTLKEAAPLLGVSTRYAKNYAYLNEIYFAGEKRGSRNPDDFIYFEAETLNTSRQRPYKIDWYVPGNHAAQVETMVVHI